MLGITGLTAYFGLLDLGKPRAGENVLVSGAAGATGSVVAQIAKHVVGCRVVGIAGGREKCAWLTGELGLDAAIDYKSEDVQRAHRRAVPGGVNVYFDNVGGGFSMRRCSTSQSARASCCAAASRTTTRRSRRRARAT